MMKEAQISTATASNRYDPLFLAVRPILSKFENLKILSFGCSEGNEVDSLKKIFPNADVLGCDIKQNLLDKLKLRDDGANFFLSNEKNITEKGPYDMICCMSVLCLHPSNVHGGVRSGLQHEQFEAIMKILSSCIKFGGLLCLYNSNFLMRHYSGNQSYAPVRSPRISHNGFTDLFYPDGQLMARGQLGTPKAAKGVSLPVRYVRGNLNQFKPEEFSDAVFMKCDSLPVEGFVSINENTDVVYDKDPTAFLTMRFFPELYPELGETPVYPFIKSEVRFYGTEGSLVKRSACMSYGNTTCELGTYVEKASSDIAYYASHLARGPM